MSNYSYQLSLMYKNLKRYEPRHVISAYNTSTPRWGPLRDHCSEEWIKQHVPLLDQGQKLLAQIGSIEAYLNGPSSESMLLYSGDPLAYELCVTLSTQEYIQIYEHSNWTVENFIFQPIQSQHLQFHLFSPNWAQNFALYCTNNSKFEEDSDSVAQYQFKPVSNVEEAVTLQLNTKGRLTDATNHAHLSHDKDGRIIGTREEDCGLYFSIGTYLKESTVSKRKHH